MSSRDAATPQPLARRLCAWCQRREIRLTARADAQYCSTRCQVAAWRSRQKDREQRDA